MSEAHMTDVAQWNGIFDHHIYKLSTCDSPTALKLTKLDETNWSSWCDQMKRALRHYELESYVDGSLECPDDPFDARNWAFNDNFAQMVIMTNIATSQSIHISQ
jgi:hypothetical protein